VGAYDVKAKTFLKGSLITAAQLKVRDRTQGFVFVDDIGNAWVTVAPGADARTRSYFHGLAPADMMLLSAFFAGPNHPLPKWAHLEKCPAP
jgi:aminoglycoside/choline kinase family phosphotransferase